MANRTGRPNVVVFFTDQQRWDSTGVHGNPLELTPNFDRMAQRGTHLYNTFTCQPVCGPARACLQTGMYATATSVWRNSIRLPANLKTLAHCFREGGYRTGYIGKWHLADRNPTPEDQRGGYEYWLGSNVLEFTSEAYRTELYDNDNKPVRLPGYRVDALTDAAIRYIDARKNDPFYLVRLVHRTALPEPFGLVPGPRWLRAALPEPLGTAGPGGPGRIDASAPGRLLGHDQAAG